MYIAEQIIQNEYHITFKSLMNGFKLSVQSYLRTNQQLYPP